MLTNCLLGWYEFKNLNVKKINIKKTLKKKFLIDIKIKKNYKNKNLSIIKNTGDRYLKFILTGKNQTELIKNRNLILDSIVVDYY